MSRKTTARGRAGARKRAGHKGAVRARTTQSDGVAEEEPDAPDAPETPETVDPADPDGIQPADLSALDTPQLRGISRTAPYFHNNSAATLEQVLDHYDAFFRFVVRTNPPQNLPAIARYVAWIAVVAPSGGLAGYLRNSGARSRSRAARVNGWREGFYVAVIICRSLSRSLLMALVSGPARTLEASAGQTAPAQIEVNNR
jgi:hypothetical protein